MTYIRIGAFLLLRAEFSFACQVLTALFWFSQNVVQLPGCVFNIVGRALGTRWAFRAMLHLGWLPRVEGCRA